MKIQHNIITINKVKLFYREAGNPIKPTILLLHGFPSSSHMFREILVELSDEYHLIAPDYPGFGFSILPDSMNFEYTFTNISSLIQEFLKQLKIDKFYLLMQDYGGPIGFRIALNQPDSILGLIIQNANIYKEGLGEWAQKIGSYSINKDYKGLKKYKNHLMSLKGIKEQYLTGARNPEKIDPISYLTDYAFISRKGVKKNQSILFDDYSNNFPKYTEWQKFLKEKQPPTLIVWGNNDKFFNSQGAKAYKNDLKNPTIKLYDSGHFMLEEYYKDVSLQIKKFISNHI